MSKLIPRRASRSIAFWITVSVFRPRKSNFTRPAASTHFMLNWVAGMSDRGIAIQRHQLVQRPVADHHTRGVGRGVAVKAFDLFGIVQKAGDHLFLLRLAQAGFIGQRLGDADGLHAFDRDHLRQLVDLTVGQLQHPAHIADGGLGQQARRR